MKRLLLSSVLLTSCGTPTLPSGQYSGDVHWEVSGTDFNSQRVTMGISRSGDHLAVTGAILFPLRMLQLPTYHCDLAGDATVGCHAESVTDEICGTVEGRSMAVTLGERLNYRASFWSHDCGTWDFQGELR